MTELIIGLTVGAVVGAVAGILFYRRHQARIESAAALAKKM